MIEFVIFTTALLFFYATVWKADNLINWLLKYGMWFLVGLGSYEILNYHGYIIHIIKT